MTVAIGFTLQPDDTFLELCDPLFRERGVLDYFEITPETTWWSPDETAASWQLLPNGFHARFLSLGQKAGKGFVGHGVGLSIGGVSRKDAARRRAWLGRLRQDQQLFGFRWYTEHLGTTVPDGKALTLPLPLLMDRRTIERVGRRLRQLATVVPTVGVENTAQYFMLGDVLDEPRFISRLLRRGRGRLLLDLHNVHTMAENFGFAAADYLDRLELEQVIEIHVSGGSYSDGSWLPGGRVLRLDSHDGAVPEPVWRLLADVVPRCVNLRGVTLERMEGTVQAGDVPLLREELRRLRAVVAGHG